ncbi:MAG: helix-hairpin-helix domain-containing protein [Flavobacteriales bacterium]
MTQKDRNGGAFRKWLRRWFGLNKAKRRKGKNAFWEDRRPLKEGLKDILDLHRSERNGFLVVSIGLILVAGWISYKQWFRQPDAVDLGPMKAEVEAFIAQEQHYASRGNAQLKVGDPEPFDPNDLDQAGWTALGLSERQSAGIMRYVDRGGHFRSKADVRKMYSITPEQFAQLSPFILLPDSTPARGARDEYREWPKDRQQWERSDSASQRYAARPARREPTVVEVNTADTLQLVELPGIGPAFARGIVKYRDKLGGYVSLDQLSEVFVLKDKPDAVVRLKELLVLDPSAVRRININTCTAEELMGHPYMWKKWSIARAVIAYRTQHGPFATVEAVKQCAVVDEDLYRQLAPYLTVGEP